MLERINGDVGAVETPIGMVPNPEDMDTTGLDIDTGDLQDLLSFDENEWRDELELIDEHYDSIGDRLPTEMRTQLGLLASRLGR